MKVINGTNVPQVYTEAFWKMRVWATEGDSRHGPVMETNDVFLEIYRPTERVLFDPIRNANPFFHVMEFVWMMAGNNDVEWIEHFNSRMREYADVGSNIIHGAYGFRWNEHFGHNQLVRVSELLAENPDTRRAVVTMWDPCCDMEHHNDLPCNTHIYFTIDKSGRLEMTVCNRSNDLVWGMLGANAVHMTLLQEALAGNLGRKMGHYKVFTKNLHVYKSLPNFSELWERTTTPYDPYNKVKPYPLQIEEGGLEKFQEECGDFIYGYRVRNPWLRNVAMSIRETYLARINGESGKEEAESIAAEDWRMAALEYIERKELAQKTSEG